jgi:intraflagellar transport protein 74
LNEAYRVFVNKKEDLEAQLNEANLSFPEARDRLQQKIKDDNAEI